MTPRCYTFIPSLCSTVRSLMKHKDKFTFTSCKHRWHYISHLTAECKKSVRTSESIPTFEKEISTSFPWLGMYILKRSPHQTAENQEGTNYTRLIQLVIKMTHSQECSLLRMDPVCTFCHHTTSTKSIINDTTFSSGIIKNRKKKESKTSCCLCKLYCLIPNP